MERGDPAARAGEDHLHEQEHRQDERDRPLALVRQPGEQCNDQQQQRAGHRQEETQAAVQVERLRVLDEHVVVPCAEDALPRQEHLKDQQGSVERNEVTQDRA